MYLDFIYNLLIRTHSLAKSLVKICLFPHNTAIAKDFAMTSVNGNLCITNVLMVNIRQEPISIILTSLTLTASLLLSVNGPLG